MQKSKVKLIKELVNKRLEEDVNHILNIVKSGFDVHVKVESKEIHEIILASLETEQKNQFLCFNIVTDPLQLDEKYETLISKKSTIIPTVLIHPDTIKYGLGFILYKVSSPELLISSPANAIEKILEHFSLDIYIDVFDSEIFRKLKLVAKYLGLNCFIDAVVQTAYLGGFKGSYSSASEYLDHILINYDELCSNIDISLEKCAENLFSYTLMQGQDAHGFIKAALSFYTVRKKGFTMTKASQLLQISRTTLQEHLKLAEKLGVSNFFEGYRQKTL
ncbi:hypothetical protein QEJ31_07485 [Pigmentibacter sp. JX0631]|uniref:hypothetical protein n=1 Tax=Pigmentibacter sp. JX0631 TaxID=2976982 RepID=UPI0024694611|nr:hypothetical protein [Pigmentibacter sp. JX0631]WGL61429.1 hypothetical protein QEJ31_07485 [Pigmentibacter sp. JX0631]